MSHTSLRSIFTDEWVNRTFATSSGEMDHSRDVHLSSCKGPSPIRRSPSIVFIGIQRTAPYPFNSQDADLILRNPIGTRFMVSKSLIAAASPFFAERLVFPKSTPATQSFPTEIELEESDVVLETTALHISSARTATKYQLLKAMQALRRMFLAPRFVDSEPVRVYAIAKRFDMEEVAEIAAKHAMKFPPIWPDYEEFKDMSAQDYHALISMHRARGRAASACLDDPQLKEILRECSSCGNNRRFWWKRYVEKTRPMLMEAPTSEVICSAGFVAEMVDTVPCRYCCESILHALLPGGVIEKLKGLLDAIQ